jgi:hypothetical protein
VGKAEVIGHEPHWRTRKVHEAAEILKGGEMVISAAIFYIHPVWRLMIKKSKNWETENSKNRKAIRTVAGKTKSGKRKTSTTV